MNQANLPLGKFAAAARRGIAAIGIECLPWWRFRRRVRRHRRRRNEQDDQNVERWRPTLERYVRS